MCQETNSVWFGSSDTCQMASLESSESLSNPSDQHLCWKGSPSQKLKNKCVLNWLWWKIQCFQAQFFFVFFFSWKLPVAEELTPQTRYAIIITFLLYYIDRVNIRYIILISSKESAQFVPYKILIPMGLKYNVQYCAKVPTHSEDS